MTQRYRELRVQFNRTRDSRLIVKILSRQSYPRAVSGQVSPLPLVARFASWLVCDPRGNAQRRRLMPFREGRHDYGAAANTFVAQVILGV